MGSSLVVPNIHIYMEPMSPEERGQNGDKPSDRMVQIQEKIRAVEKTTDGAGKPL